MIMIITGMTVHFTPLSFYDKRVLVCGVLLLGYALLYREEYHIENREILLRKYFTDTKIRISDIQYIEKNIEMKRSSNPVTFSLVTNNGRIQINTAVVNGYKENIVDFLVKNNGVKLKAIGNGKYFE